MEIQQAKHVEKLVDIDHHLSLKENKLFKDYHEARVRKRVMEIEEGLIDDIEVDED